MASNIHFVTSIADMIFIFFFRLLLAYNQIGLPPAYRGAALTNALAQDSSLLCNACHHHNAAPLAGLRLYVTICPISVCFQSEFLSTDRCVF
jgi:hypothetical protein